MSTHSELEKIMTLVHLNYLDKLEHNSKEYDIAATKILDLFKAQTSLQNLTKDISEVLNGLIDSQETELDAEELSQIYEDGLFSIMDGINITTIVYGLLHQKEKEKK